MSRTTTKIIIAQEDGTVVGQYFLGQGEHLIGRESHCTIQLEADHVSREHARLIISADAIEIEDLDSTSGTYLDGISVKGRIPIQPGQKLWISDLYIDIERQGFGGLIEGSRLGDGRFTLKRELGKGGMGAVWLALYEETQENFALKLVSGEISLDPESLKELQREVNKSHKLVHPNIVRMGYFWKEEGEPAFISLEYVDGTDLHQLRSDSPNGLLAWKDVQTYMLQLCDALEYAHTQKVAHRDIKPSNFMIDREGNLKLADFGIAATLNSSSLSFTSSSVLGSGTPPYMSPQQLDGKRPQVTDDIYSIGATFYDLLTSNPPFYQGDISYQVRHTEVSPMAERLKELELANDIPEYVSAIVMACLQKDPAQRPQSMQVIREWIQSGVEVAVEPEKVSPTSARETQRLDPTPLLAARKAAGSGFGKEPASVATPQPSRQTTTSATPTKMGMGAVCPQCNATVQSGQLVCTVCGSHLRAMPSADKMGTGKLIAIIVGTVMIFGCLASVLLPALARAKAKDNRIKCMNNLSTIGKVTLGFNQDNGGRTPWNLIPSQTANHFGSAPSGTAGAIFGLRAMKSEIQSAKFLLSPCDPARMPDNEVLQAGWANINTAAGNPVTIGTSYVFCQGGDFQRPATIVALTRNLNSNNIAAGRWSGADESPTPTNAMTGLNKVTRSARAR
jgi:serine/threonine protein kinase/type II secretory pathway pseudopilin PulG